jgi:hypothetical protein
MTAAGKVADNFDLATVEPGLPTALASAVSAVPEDSSNHHV